MVSIKKGAFLWTPHEKVMKSRLKLYQKLLGKETLYGRIIRQMKADAGLSVSEELYLYVFAPAIMEFARWTLHGAVRAGKKRLYFLSRDGYPIWRAACVLAGLEELSVECRYLHVSRYCLRVPSYHLNLRGSLERICAGGMAVTPERILKRGALTDGEAEEVAALAGWGDRYRDILNRRQIRELKEALGNEPLFLNYVERHSLEAYGNAMGYLQQEGLLSDIPYAIVDSGWVGTVQQSLQTLVHSRMPHIRIEGYYFGLYELPPEADAGDYHGWYFTPERGLRRKANFSNSLFEAVCSADQGMTTGYGQRNGRYLPRTDPAGNPNGERLGRNLEVLERFLENYAGEAGGAGERTACGRRRVQALLTAFMARPSALEAGRFGDYLFSDDVLAGNVEAVAVPLTKEELRSLYILRRLFMTAGPGRGRLRESAWAEGSIVRCGRRKHYIRKNLRHLRWYKYLVFGRKQLGAVKMRIFCDKCDKKEGKAR